MALVETQDRGAVRHVVLNRPEKRNAFHADLVLAVGAALRAAADDPGTHCVVLRGEGPMFSSGMDLGALAELGGSPDALRPFRRACIGGALELALACDLRVAAAGTVLGMPEVRLGLIPDVGGSSRLPQVVGLGRAKELVMTGKLIGAEDAERIGLANRVAPADELE